MSFDLDRARRRPVSFAAVDDHAVMLDGIASGQVAEVFACGTAAVVTPIGEFADAGGRHRIGTGESGEHTLDIRQSLLDIQHGRREDPYGWMRRIA